MLSLADTWRASRCLHLILGCVAILCCAFATSAQASVSLPPQGIYDQCSPVSETQHCLDNLQQVGAAGFKVILNYELMWSTPAEIKQYAAAAASAGVKVIWPLSDAIWRNGGDLASYYAQLGSGCPGCSHDDFVRYFVNMVKDLPATWGFYIGDEVPPAEAAQVAALSALVKSVDPSHPLLLIAKEGASTDGANLVPFTASADVVGADCYPWGIPGGSPSDVGWTSRLVQSTATAAGKQSAMVIQAFDWSQYAGSGVTTPNWPSESVMQQERDQVLTNSKPSLLMWYSLYDIQRSANPAAHWADLKKAAFATLPGQTVNTAVARVSDVRPAAKVRHTRRRHHVRSSRHAAVLRARHHHLGGSRV